MRTWKLAVCCVGIGCGTPESQGVDSEDSGALFPDIRGYHRPLFKPGDCPEDFNCSQWVTLCPDGRALLLVTDIGNQGHYALYDETLVFTADAAGDVEAMEFVVVPEDDILVDLDGNVWARDDSPEVEFCTEEVPG